MNTHVIVSDIRQDVLKMREDIGGQNKVVSDTRHFYRHILSDYP